ncbi:hypothetical protein [Streptomyces cremeus]|uniref:hypothetical protein n=1 Tax=Streptomyces cremeus TaxID=66881 RepID=UPI0031F0C5E9
MARSILLDPAQPYETGRHPVADDDEVAAGLLVVISAGLTLPKNSSLSLISSVYRTEIPGPPGELLQRRPLRLLLLIVSM